MSPLGWDLNWLTIKSIISGCRDEATKGLSNCPKLHEQPCCCDRKTLCVHSLERGNITSQIFRQGCEIRNFQFKMFSSRGLKRLLWKNLECSRQAQNRQTNKQKHSDLRAWFAYSTYIFFQNDTQNLCPDGKPSEGHTSRTTDVCTRATRTI